MDKIIITGEQVTVSDGYHTFEELYDHRITLYIALCHCYDDGAWRSKLHSDGSSFEGWFVLGIGKDPGKQITYHLPLSRWDECEFAETLERAPEFDGHTPADVLARLKEVHLDRLTIDITDLPGYIREEICRLADSAEGK